MSQYPTSDEFLEEQARAIANQPPERIVGAEHLPDDVRDGRIEDVGEAHADVQEQLITELKEE